MKDCKYCDEKYQKSERTVLENESWFANFDGHPVNPGHMKIIPKRHVNSVSELTDQEMVSFKSIYVEVEKLTGEKFNWDGYNFGGNHGAAAGQTVFHLHIHFMPRFYGDVENPIGGVRNIIPGKGNYLISEK
jgi:diadenosine tetraphosphate (Ap4A) HIT family hydrolase